MQREELRSGQKKGRVFAGKGGAEHCIGRRVARLKGEGIGAGGT